jgi:hypothetical protein
LFSSNENDAKIEESDNVGLFAAGDRVSAIKKDDVFKPKEEIVISKSILELQAEFLRLEAEKEEIIISQSRIDDEKV